ncbi:MAG TPA: signal peptidase I [Chromatiales bacterium]|nr:signal peptidase I [Chromatiales bacterium]
MNFDFPTLLVLACLLTGGIWLIDAVFFAPARKKSAVAAAAAGEAPAPAAGKRERYGEPLLVEYARSFFPVILIVLILRSFLVEPFRIPSGSMMPTLLVGDFILVNKYAYGIRLPVTDTKIIEVGEPKRGDVVVFRYPANPSIDYIKRVVAVPGDTVGYHDKTIFINGKAMPKTLVGLYTGVGSGSRETGALQAVEQLDEVEHRVLIHPFAPDLPPGCSVLEAGPVEVPEGHYFVMGDNRDNSNDSRCWGFVPDTHLVGKAFGIWMHWDTGRKGFPIAWERIGDAVK